MRPSLTTDIGAVTRRVGTAIEVVRGPSGEACPGLRHWTPYLLSGGQDTMGDDTMGSAACGVRIAGMVLAPGTPDDISCDGCAIEYVAWRLRNIAG